MLLGVAGCPIASWLGSDLIAYFSSSMPIKRGVIEEIGAATPIGKGKDKKIKKEVGKKSQVEESVEGTEADQGTKRRKTALAHKQLNVLKDPREVDPSIVEKEASHPSIPNIRVKTKVETSILQIPMGSPKGTSFVVVTSLAQGSSGFLAITLQSPQGPSGHTIVSRRLLQNLQRERKGQDLIPSSLILSSSVNHCLLILFCGFFYSRVISVLQYKHKYDPKGAKSLSSSDVVV